MNRIPVIKCLAILGGLCGISLLTGCQTSFMTSGKGKYSRLVKHVVAQEPYRVVRATEATLTRLQLRDIRPATTAIDASFYFKNANDREYRILVTGIKATKTRVEIYGINRKEDYEQANLIYDNILAQLQME